MEAAPELDVSVYTFAISLVWNVIFVYQMWYLIWTRPQELEDFFGKHQ